MAGAGPLALLVADPEERRRRFVSGREPAGPKAVRRQGWVRRAFTFILGPG